MIKIDKLIDDFKQGNIGYIDFKQSLKELIESKKPKIGNITDLMDRCRDMAIDEYSKNLSEIFEDGK